jgi:hypothetical protein
MTLSFYATRAAENGRKAVVKLLLEKGADVEAKSNDGDPAKAEDY